LLALDSAAFFSDGNRPMSCADSISSLPPAGAIAAM
jgi:hypothetical protein